MVKRIADRGVGRHQPDGNRSDTRDQQRYDQCRLTTDAVAPMAKDRRPDRPTEKADEKDRERLQHADDRIRLREKSLPKTSPVTCP
jgi:hypothetical protein